MGMNVKREMIRDIQDHINRCIDEIAAAMEEYGYFYDIEPENVNTVFDNYKQVYKQFPNLAKKLLTDALTETNGNVKKLEKSFVHYKKICSQFEYPNDRVLD